MRGSDAKHVTPGTEGRNRGALVQAWRDRTRSGAAGATQGWSDGKLGIAFDGNGTGELIVCATVRTDGDGMPDPARRGRSRSGDHGAGGSLRDASHLTRSARNDRPTPGPAGRSVASAGVALRHADGRTLPV
jgi:hypothetical protein